MQIIEVTVIDWREGRFISRLYMDQSIKIRLDQGGDKKCEDWKRRQKMMLFVTPYIQLLKLLSYRGCS
jgi:hypothetical protein